MAYNSRFLPISSTEVGLQCTCGGRRWVVCLRIITCRPTSEGGLHERCRTNTRSITCRIVFYAHVYFTMFFVDFLHLNAYDFCG